MPNEETATVEQETTPAGDGGVDTEPTETETTDAERSDQTSGEQVDGETPDESAPQGEIDEAEGAESKNASVDAILEKLNVPDDMPMDRESLEFSIPKLAEAGFTDEQMQAAAQVYADNVTRMMQDAQGAADEAVEQDRASLQEELGEDGYKNAVANRDKVFEKIPEIGEQLREVLTAAMVIDHPAVTKALAMVGEGLTEEGAFVKGTPVAPEEPLLSDAEVFANRAAEDAKKREAQGYRSS